MIVALVMIFAMLACLVGQILFNISRSMKKKKALSITLKIIASVLCFPLVFLAFMAVLNEIDSHKIVKNYEKENGKLFAKLVYSNEKAAIRALKSESDMNVVNKEGETPLLIVARRGDGDNFFEAMKLCVEKGADVNKSDKHGKTALHYALENMMTKEAVKYLIEHGADVNKKDADGFSPLMTLAQSFIFYEKSALEVADMLLEAGADESATNNGGENAAAIIQKQLDDRKKWAEQHPDIDIEKNNLYITGKALLEKLK